MLFFVLVYSSCYFLLLILIHRFRHYYCDFYYFLLIVIITITTGQLHDGPVLVSSGFGGPGFGSWEQRSENGKLFKGSYYYTLLVLSRLLLLTFLF